MQTDELEIRQLVTTWMTASKAGDIQKVLSLMTEDVVFLMPGQSIMRKADFAAAMQAQSRSYSPSLWTYWSAGTAVGSRTAFTTSRRAQGRGP